MFRNYFKTAWRNLLKNKLNAVINITGLSVAFICCILLSLTVYYEYSYDNFQENAASIYKTYHVDYTANADDKNSSMGYPVAPIVKSELQGVVKSTSFMSVGNGVAYKEKELEKNIVLVDNDFFSMFSFPIVAGNNTSPLGSLSDVVINKSTADAMFGAENPIGKDLRVKIAGEWKNLVVSSVIADAPDNSTIRYEILARIELGPAYAEKKTDWNTQHHAVYVQLAPNITQAQAERGLRNITKQYMSGEDERRKKEGYRKDAYGDMYAIKLAPLKDLHFDHEVGPGNAITKNYLNTLILIAIIVMIIACFNFINLNVARAFTRAREVGVRKTLGAGRKQIFIQLWIESFLLCLIALFIALFATYSLLGPFNSLFTEKIKLSAMVTPGVIVCVLAGILLVSFLSGGYPAWMVSKFKAVEVLKGKISVNRSSYLRNGLITFQFIMASLLLCGTFVIYRQFEHMRNAPLGFEQQSLISIPIAKREKSNEYIRQLRLKLANNPQVLSVSGSSANIGIGEDGSQSTTSIGFDYMDKHIYSHLLTVDYDYLKTIGVKPLEGREFSNAFAADTARDIINVVVTENVAKQFGASSALDLTLSGPDAPRWHIVGIIPDYHLYSMNQKLEPITLLMNKTNQLGYILVKVKTANPAQTLGMVKDIYKTIEPAGTTNPSYVTENTRRWYDKEKRLSGIFFAASAIAVLLSCLGLFAIVSLVMEQRKKEIGVRKVLGASVTSITALLSKDFLKLVLIALVIALPAAWYFLTRWLENFSYRIHISIWLFAAAAVIVLLIALITVSFQTVKASLANPVKSLRSE